MAVYVVFQDDDKESLKNIGDQLERIADMLAVKMEEKK